MTINLTSLVDKIVGGLGDKKRWRAYNARVDQLPTAYRTATKGIERYLTYYGSITKGDILMNMLEDLADLVEGAAADGTPIRGIVGDDPVEFAETFARNYSDGQWINKERARLVDTIAHAEEAESR